MIDSFWNSGDQILVWALNVVLQVGLAATLATLFGLALRRSSAARYWMLCSALLVVMACLGKLKLTKNRRFVNP